MKSIFENDQTGKTSSKRAVFVFTNALWTIALLTVWIITSIKTGSISDIPQSIITVYLMVCGITGGISIGGTAIDNSKGKT